MRQFREPQLPLVPVWGTHQHTRELEMVGRILEENPAIARLVHADVVAEANENTGRPGLRV